MPKRSREPSFAAAVASFEAKHRRTVSKRPYRGRKAIFGPTRPRDTGGELKFFEENFTDAVIAIGATVVGSLNLIAGGVLEDQRIGRKCTIRSIGIKFDVSMPASAGAMTTGDIVRIMLLLDRQANGALPANTDVLEAASYLSFNQLANKSRFSTLFDRTYALNAVAWEPIAGATAGVNIADSFYKKVEIPLEFNAGAGVIAEVRTNNLVWIAMSRTELCKIAGKCRIRFSDN